MTYSEKLIAFANKITKDLSYHEAIRAIFIGGSVCRGIADRYSDLELFFIWGTDISTEERDAVFNSIQHDVLVEETDEGGGEWTMSIVVENIKIDIYHWTDGYIDTLRERIFEQSNTSPYIQLPVASILDSDALAGDEYMRAIKQMFSVYPRALAQKALKENAFFESWSLRYALLERNDPVALLNLVNETLLQIMRLLFAINETYLRSHNCKWLNYQLNLLDIKPDNFIKKATFITQNINAQGIEALDSLLKESLNLANKNSLNIDLAKEITYLEYVRKPN